MPGWFHAWLEKRYSGLHSLPATQPVMVHHLARYLASHLGSARETKLALVLLDGLSLGQWMAIQRILSSMIPSAHFKLQACFAWIPTLTSISRQAIFSGHPPRKFGETILQTGKDERHWRAFWAQQGLDDPWVEYSYVVGDIDVEGIRGMIENSMAKVLGVVVGKIDKIMHGMELGMAGMHSQTIQWASEGFLCGLLNELLVQGFQVFITSDHGNVEAVGWGQPKEGSMAEARGERVRLFNEELLRDHVASDYPDAIRWPTIGLPDDLLALMAPYGRAFASQGVRTVSHGGASLEEVIVPWVEVRGMPPSRRIFSTTCSPIFPHRIQRAGDP